MTDPKVTIEEQERRHRGPVVGIVIGLIFVALLAMFLLMDGSDDEIRQPVQDETITPRDSNVVVPTTPGTVDPVDTQTTVPITN